MKRLAIAVIVAVGLSAGPASAQTSDDAFRKDILKLLELTGSLKMGIQMANIVSAQYIDGLQKSNPQVPQRALELTKEVLSAEFTKAFESPDGLTPQLVSIYAKHFTHQEVLALIAFYETELGQKTVAKMPQVMQEAAALGQRWAESNVPRIVKALDEKLRAEGLIK
jgi:hypothetical protein